VIAPNTIIDTNAVFPTEPIMKFYDALLTTPINSLTICIVIIIIISSRNYKAGHYIILHHGKKWLFIRLRKWDRRLS
jgi:hypothetical protein